MFLKRKGDMFFSKQNWQPTKTTETKNWAKENWISGFRGTGLSNVSPSVYKRHEMFNYISQVISEVTSYANDISPCLKTQERQCKIVSDCLPRLCSLEPWPCKRYFHTFSNKAWGVVTLLHPLCVSWQHAFTSPTIITLKAIDNSPLKAKIPTSPVNQP